MNKLIIFMLFASCMLIAGVGEFAYADKTNSEQSELTAVQIGIEKAVNTDYAISIVPVATCGVAPEIKSLYLYWVLIDEATIITAERRVILCKLARDALISQNFV